MRQPGDLANIVPPDDGDIYRRLRDIERDLDELRGARRLEAASIGAGGLQSAGFAHGATGWRLSGDGNLEVNDITLRGGIIGNDALTSPVTAGTGFADVNSTDFSAAGGDFAIGTIAVPAGFTKALVMCTGSVGDTRTLGAGTGFVQCAAWFGRVGATSTETGAEVISAHAADGASMSLTSAWSNLITGLPAGSSLRFGVWASVQSGGWKAGAANAHTNALALFLR